MHADSLADDLQNHLYWWAHHHPGGNARWVMDIAWLNEVRHLDRGYAFSMWYPRPVGTVETILGVPVEIREQDERPGWMWRVPHLEKVELT